MQLPLHWFARLPRRTIPDPSCGFHLRLGFLREEDCDRAVAGFAKSPWLWERISPLIAK
jgi:hypothetical protein